MSDATEDAVSRVAAFHRGYIAALDDRNVEAWAALFAAESSYRIVARANLDRGLPLALVRDTTKGRILDRVTFIRKFWANNYQDYNPRHFIQVLDAKPSPDLPGAIVARTNVAVYFTEDSGRSEILAVGEYRDTLVTEDGELRIREKTVVVDTTVLPRYVVYPL
jgi:3-phenylpropionate/cinnamic acid dioxygenase small subunit